MVFSCTTERAAQLRGHGGKGGERGVCCHSPAVRAGSRYLVTLDVWWVKGIGQVKEVEPSKFDDPVQDLVDTKEMLGTNQKAEPT